MKKVLTLVFAIVLSGSMAFAQNNDANVDQLGASNEANIEQVGDANNASIGQGENNTDFGIRYGGPTGAFVNLDMDPATQSEGNLATIAQTGSKNNAIATQGYDGAWSRGNEIVLEQTGTENAATTLQGVGGIVVDDNYTEVLQEGYRNDVEVAQGELWGPGIVSTNTFDSELYVLQNGNENVVRAGQIGSGQFADIDQTGNFNSSVVNQSN